MTLLRSTRRGLLPLATLVCTTALLTAGTPAVASPAPSVPPDGTPIAGRVTSTAMTPAQAWNTVKYNRIYRTGKLGAAQCREPRYPLNNAGNIKAWHTSFLYCLNNVWVHKVRAAKYRFAKPTLVVHTSGIRDPKCGFIPADNEYYCAGTRRIFVPWRLLARWWHDSSRGPLFVRAYAMHTFAHEYGHHVQHLTGILAAQLYRQRYVLKTTAADLQENRRMELQASCLSGGYVGANRNHYPVRGDLLRWYQWMIKNLGDQPGRPRDHGSKSSHNFWTTRGWHYQSAYACMTWAAGSAYVD